MNQSCLYYWQDWINRCSVILLLFFSINLLFINIVNVFLILWSGFWYHNSTEGLLMIIVIMVIIINSPSCYFNNFDVCLNCRWLGFNLIWMTIVFVNRHLYLVRTSHYFDMVLVPEWFDNSYSTISGGFDILAIIS